MRVIESTLLFSVRAIVIRHYNQVGVLALFYKFHTARLVGVWAHPFAQQRLVEDNLFVCVQRVERIHRNAPRQARQKGKQDHISFIHRRHSRAVAARKPQSSLTS